VRRLTVFNNVSLDGFFTDQKGDMSWAHKNDLEWNAFSTDLKGTGERAFGNGNVLVCYEPAAAP
jgi:hypothetical protein